ncbi:MAG: hypothetical protein A2513_10805 [Sulfurimonas sp. RIFOXYD12_FULL_33_39]|uniref:hypothetical protein n=1 Tax=unclassified Sulfurimonas TaxID=2623549 RepID=UPI0008C5C140|nr:MULTISPECIES: hypothetical protein [unclassified Sulfurimonas]OHE05810.1 MAG: hypothetical protein A3G74_09515 [Sulfurimonas sp. RIFCSPLOWO2_12_FULL_34_6]OHE09796.1 MAG: hypothetical protein A2513_10805 [Sulfurimonas sp. RIFOXYD12_FULL_33_39]OHE13696.1 MAG: hypothetical protein A2530_08950 [Sulfurimonas sp. RIFOXYD2_FULL_34_21]
MKKIKILITAVSLLLMTGCGSKVPFKESAPVEDASIAYIYMPNYSELADGSSSQNFTIRINDKSVEGRIKSNEYMLFDLKPQKIKFSATRDSIEEKSVTLDLKVGETYYLRIRDNLQNGGFSFENISKEIAKEEIVKTGLAGSVLEDVNNVITELVGTSESKKEEPSVQVSTVKSTSKIDELEKAYKLKEKGALTDEEFKTLKSQIISK